MYIAPVHATARPQRHGGQVVPARMLGTLVNSAGFVKNEPLPRVTVLRREQLLALNPVLVSEVAGSLVVAGFGNGAMNRRLLLLSVSTFDHIQLACSRTFRWTE